MTAMELVLELVRQPPVKEEYDFDGEDYTFIGEFCGFCNVSTNNPPLLHSSECLYRRACDIADGVS